LFVIVQRVCPQNHASTEEIPFLHLTQPEDVGMGHTKIIQDLQQLMIHDPPTNRIEYLRHLGLAMVQNMCEPNNVQCMRKLVKNTLQRNIKYDNGLEYISQNLAGKVGGLDSTVLDSMEKLFYSLSLASFNENPRDILRVMNRDLEELKVNSEVKNEQHRTIGLIAYSVGMESTKQWHEIFNDSSGPIPKLMAFMWGKKHSRNLQNLDLNTILQLADVLGIELDIVDIIEADVIGATAGAISAAFDASEGNTVSVFDVALALGTEYSVRFLTDSIIPDVPQIPTFPGTPGGGILPNPDPSPNPNDCQFPNIPFLCPDNSTVDNIFDNDSPTQSPVQNNSDDNSNSNNVIAQACALFPNNPLCGGLSNTETGNTNNNTIVNDISNRPSPTPSPMQDNVNDISNSNSPTASPMQNNVNAGGNSTFISEAITRLCATFPNNPQCL